LVDERRVAFRDLLAKSPADIADVLRRLSTDEATELVRRLVPRRAAAEPLGEMEPEDSAELLQQLEPRQAALILSRMDPDDAVDVLDELPAPLQDVLLGDLPEDAAQVLSGLLSYGPDTAGGLMTPEFVAFTTDMTTEAAISVLRQRVEEAETIYYVYATDPQGHLRGVVALRDLALARSDTRLGALVVRDTVAVHVTADVEDVARIFDKYDYFALPVVDDENRLLGIITIDDVLDVIRSEATEDIYGLEGVPSQERVGSRWTASWVMRLPWLYLRLGTAMAAAVVVGLFEASIARVAALAVLMGVIAGQGGSAGMQTVTILTRAMALGELQPGEGWRLLGKEMLLGLINGVLIGGTVGVVTYIWKGEMLLGLAAFLAMLMNLVVAGATGVVIPLGVRFFGKDPAVVSGIFLTTITDVLGFGFLFLLAHLLLPGMLR
jgi:magnesium transporter